MESFPHLAAVAFPLGAVIEEGGARFRVWAPRPRMIELELDGLRVPMVRGEDGYHEAFVDGAAAGGRYGYVLDRERMRPDPASRFQPGGVHGPSEIVDPRAFEWRHGRPRRPRAEWVFYELHVGTFTKEGTFDAAARELSRLVDLGVTAVELMPVAAFSGARNWGYDGVCWFAPQASYGGPAGLRRFVDAAHGHGLAVVMDVVYNHFGPEGNYVGEFGPYFTTQTQTPWGDALDYAAPPVRAHVLGAARVWLDEYRVDALRLDAVHAIFDESPRHIVSDLASACHERGALAIAESDLHDPMVLEKWGADAEWADDLHHALHAALAGERTRYYADFGSAAAIARAFTDSYVFTGQESVFHGRRFGKPVRHVAPDRFVVCSQNHDQLGNRGRGERLAQLVPGCEFVAATVVLLAPGLPLLFMGEEHSDPAPFLYFTDHQDQNLARAVSEGRRREHAWEGDVPDPQAEETFLRSRIELALGERGRHAEVRRFYRALLRLRRERPSLRETDRARTQAAADDATGVLTLRRASDFDETIAWVNLSSRLAWAELVAPRFGALRVILAGNGAEVRNRTSVSLPAHAVLICGSDG